MNLFMSLWDILKGIELNEGALKVILFLFIVDFDLRGIRLGPSILLDGCTYASSYPFLLLLLDGSVGRGEYGPLDLSSLSVECQKKRSLYSTC